MPTLHRAMMLMLTLLLAATTSNPAWAGRESITNKGADKGPSAVVSELSQLAGRQVWMVNAPREQCNRMEALGMIVECDEQYESYGMEREIVIWCQQFDHGIAAKILDHLGHPDFDQRTHVSYPPGTDNNECGMLYEITIRYEPGGGAPAAQPATTPSSPSMIFSKVSTAPATTAAPTTTTTGISELSQLSGRQIWMVNAPQADCAKMRALGMIVDCEQGRDTMGMEHEIVIWCEQFDHAIAGKILDHLGHSNFDQRTHQTYPPGTDNNECGMLYEITIRYEDAG